MCSIEHIDLLLFCSPSKLCSVLPALTYRNDNRNTGDVHGRKSYHKYVIPPRIRIGILTDMTIERCMEMDPLVGKILFFENQERVQCIPRYIPENNAEHHIH